VYAVVCKLVGLFELRCRLSCRVEHVYNQNKEEPRNIEVLNVSSYPASISIVQIPDSVDKQRTSSTMVNIVAGVFAAWAMFVPVQAIDMASVGGAGGEGKLTTWGQSGSRWLLGRSRGGGHHSGKKKPRHDVRTPPSYQVPSCGKSGKKCCWCGAHLK
jgi:hypothetical protein